MRTPGPRKARRLSLSVLREHELPDNPHLPLLEPPSELDPPPARVVARRTIVLTRVIGVGYDAHRGDLVDRLKEHDLWRDVTPSERVLLTEPAVAEHEIVDARWLTECIQTLAWALRIVGLPLLRRCDGDLASRFPRPRESPHGFIESASLRPYPEIYAMCDLLYCLHWAAREDRLRRRPSRLDERTIAERHRAILWLAGVEREWDEISTDT